ncbi:acetamidase/formamidase family protein [Solimonas soli]|uniref:acetamidase/formamidase family protein n=1 Tax=Solimonas soli TaxID=413479 RepID=UPI00047FCF9A|nr:acetamidase/formamidase family protein [Solimonas soli]
MPKEKIPNERDAAYEGVEGDGRGDHTLNGPVYIRGAEPGDTLEIRIRSVDVRFPIAGQGFRPGRGVLPDEFNYQNERVLWIDHNLIHDWIRADAGANHLRARHAILRQGTCSTDSLKAGVTSITKNEIAPIARSPLHTRKSGPHR